VEALLIDIGDNDLGAFGGKQNGGFSPLARAGSGD
jgi:hypothetical protein